MRKAGGKFKMNPLFPSTVAKIKAVSFSFPFVGVRNGRELTDTEIQMLEQDQPVRDGAWTTAEIELINEKVTTSSFRLSMYQDS